MYKKTVLNFDCVARWQSVPVAACTAANLRRMLDFETTEQRAWLHGVS